MLAGSPPKIRHACRKDTIFRVVDRIFHVDLETKAAAVPEPSTFLLMLFGIAGLKSRAWRKRRR